ncbi:MAG: hypothetical protein ACLUV5_15220, partial [Oscillospiraceae bacterium]
PFKYVLNPPGSFFSGGFFCILLVSFLRFAWQTTIELVGVFSTDYFPGIHDNVFEYQQENIFIMAQIHYGSERLY